MKQPDPIQQSLDPTRLRVASSTSVGRVRTKNEDHFGEFESERGRLLVVADGMGGHLGGATASHLAVESVGDHFSASREDPERLLREALEQANQRIFQTSVENESLRGMGTTAVLLLVEREGAWVAHVGDSRAYRLRDGELEPLTDDHSVVFEMIRRGLITPDEAAVHPRRNEILRSVGVEQKIQADVVQVDIRPGDRFLLCSDGLSSMLPDAEICDLSKHPDPERVAKILIDAANDCGGTDNITVQIIDLPRRLHEIETTTHPLAVDAPGDAPERRSARWPWALALGAGLALLALLLLSR